MSFSSLRVRFNFSALVPVLGNRRLPPMDSPTGGLLAKLALLKFKSISRIEKANCYEFRIINITTNTSKQQHILKTFIITNNESTKGKIP